MTKQVQQLDRVIIRFAGDSGDGMQLAGDRFTQETAAFGNDLSTLPNFPAEIRAPAGTLPGVSSFQLHFADHDILTPGDAPDVLVAMNPAALKANLADVPRGADIIANTDEFTKRNLTRVGYTANPLEDGSLSGYNVHAVAVTSMTVKALEEIDVSRKEAERAKNMFALGLLSWLYNRPLEGTLKFLKSKFANKPEIMKANITAFQAGWNFGETTEAFSVQYEVKPATLAPGTYRNITGNSALSYGLVAASRRSGLPLFLGAYPITPASDILHELSKHKRFGVRTFQAEDEISGVGAALGASFGGALGVTSTSGPGMALKAETIGLAVSLELPLIVIDVQRAGPSTGMPTKTEQADLLMALYGRNGESPVAVLAPATPSDCFEIALEAVRIATKYRTPVIILSDGYLANGSEPWRIPDVGRPAEAAGRVLLLQPRRMEQRGRRQARLPALPAEPGHPGPAVGHSGHPRPGAPHRRDREGRRHRHHLLRRRSTTTGWSGCARRRSTASRPTSGRSPWTTRTARPRCWCWAGDPRSDLSAPRCAGSGWRAARWPRPTCATCPRSRPTSATSWPATTRCWSRRSTWGSSRCVLRGRYLTDVISYNRVRGLPFRAAELAGVIQDVIDNV